MMRRRILRSANGPAPVHVATPNSAVFHVRTHHDKELSRLSKGAREATIELPLAGQRNNSSNRSQDLRAATVAGVLHNADTPPSLAARRTRREVNLGTFSPSQTAALVPANRTHELTTFDGDNNVRFKIHVTDQKGPERPTKILAALANGASLQRQEGVVKLTRSSFHTPTIREIGSNEDICQLDNDQSSEKLKSAKNAHDLWNEALVKKAEKWQRDADLTSNRPRQRVKTVLENQPSLGRKNVEKQWTPDRKQEQNKYQKRQRSPKIKMPSPPPSPSTSDQRSEDSLTRSNETRSNLYGYRRRPRHPDRYQQGASILKTPAPNVVPVPHRRPYNYPFYPQDDPYCAPLHPPVQCFPPTRPSVQPCVTCQYAPCSTCKASICAVCMAEPCASCCAPLCSACNIASYSANNETLCMSCALPLRSRYSHEFPYNRSAATGTIPPHHPSAEVSPVHTPPQEDAPAPAPQPREVEPFRPSREIPTYRLQCDYPPSYPSPRESPQYHSSRALPPGYPRHLSPCSPFIDWAARRNLPPLIPNYVCEPVACTPCDPIPDDISCQTAPILPRKNQFLQLFSRSPACSVRDCSSCCCQQQADMGDTASVICPTNWVRCGPQRSLCDQRYCQPEESCLNTVLHVVWIIVPVIISYVLMYFGMTRLLALNKFSRLAAVMANTTLLYILTLEPDDLIAYPTDKPKVKPATLPPVVKCAPAVCPPPSPSVRRLGLSSTDVCRVPR